MEVQKNPDYKMWTADFIQNWWRSGLKNLDKFRIFINKFVRDHLYHQFNPTGFPCSIESIEKVLNFKIGFQDLEKVLNLVKKYIRYWKNIEILNGKEIWSIWT